MMILIVMFFLLYKEMLLDKKGKIQLFINKTASFSKQKERTI